MELCLPKPQFVTNSKSKRALFLLGGGGFTFPNLQMRARQETRQAGKQTESSLCHFPLLTIHIHTQYHPLYSSGVLSLLMRVARG